MTSTVAERPYDELMADAKALLDTGKFAEAARAYDEALSVTDDLYQQIAAFQMQGIACSRAGNLLAASTVFDIALVLAADLGDDVLMFRLMRDVAMAYMDAFMRRPLLALEHLRKAESLLHTSAWGLRDLGELEEAYVSEGFIGRHELLMDSPVLAAMTLKEAHRNLKELSPINPDYVLNNLMWLIRAVPRKERRQYESEIRELIEITGQTRRYAELRVIMLGGDFLYRLSRLVPDNAVKLATRVIKK